MALNIILLILGLLSIPPCFFMMTEKELPSANGLIIDIIPLNSVFEITLALTGLAIVICGLLQLKAHTNYAVLNIMLGLAITALSALITVQIIRTGYFDIPILHIFGLMLLACSFGIISVALVQLKARFNDPAQESEQLPENAGL